MTNSEAGYLAAHRDAQTFGMEAVRNIAEALREAAPLDYYVDGYYAFTIEYKDKG